MSREKKWIVLIGSAALALRLGFVFWGTPGSRVENLPGQGRYVGDPHYFQFADNLLEKGSYEIELYGFTYKAWRPPLFPLFIAAVSKIHGLNPVMPVRIYLALLSMAVPFCVWLLARTLWSWREGVTAFAWACVHPHFVFYSGHVMPETLFVVFSTAGFTLMMLERSAMQSALAGLLTGLACLGRSQFAGAALIGAAWPFVNPKPAARKAWGIFFMAGFLLAVGPWWIRNYAVFGKFVPFSTEGGYTLWVGANPLADGGGDCPSSNPPQELGELGMDRWHYGQAVSYMKENPGKMVSLAFQKLRRFWGIVPVQNVSIKIKIISFVSFMPLFVLALAGLWFWRRRFRELGPVLGLLLYYTVIQSVFPSMIRYRLVLEPFLIVLAAAAAVRLADGIAESSVKK
ncbi:MAG: glycosyltransferase family 39 protein [bacterium]